MVTGQSALRRQLRILIVEDNADGWETLRILLELLGYEVEVAADGVEGLERGLSLRPDVVLLDIGLPRLDGYQLARRLRAVLGEDVFLIAQTGYGQSSDRERAWEAGFNAYLVKPIKVEELSRWLAVAVAHRPPRTTNSDRNAPAQTVNGDAPEPVGV